MRKYFNEESKKAAVDLVNSIREEYVNILKEVSWMDEVTRQAAIEKAKSMTSHIAYPDELTDNNKLEEYYDGLELEPDTLLQNVLRIRIFKDNHLIKKLRQPVNKTDWETHTMPATVNAAYSPLENSIRKYNELNNNFSIKRILSFFQQNFLPPFFKIVSFQLIGKYSNDF